MARRLLGVDLLDDVASVGRRILEHPRSFPEWQGKPGVRRALLERFAFAIGFVVGPMNAEPPLIVVIAHAKRRPGSWLARKRVRKTKRGAGR